MATRAVTHGGVEYTIADDDPARGEWLPWALLRTRVVDELTLQAPTVPISLTSDLAGARPRVADGGVCGLVGRPADVSARMVLVDGFRAEVSAPGYLPRDLTPAIDLARRTLSTAAVGGATAPLDVGPPDPVPRRQFLPGRGVLVERAAPGDPEFFTTVASVSPAPGAADVPISAPVDTTRSAGLHVAGIPMTLPDQPLHRDGIVRIAGRVRVRTGPNVAGPAVGAEVGIRGVWWDYPSSLSGAPQPPELCAVTPSVRLVHPIGAAVDRCALNPVGPARSLRTHAAAGSRQLVVGPGGGMTGAGGDLLRLGDPLTGDDEVVVTAIADPVTDPAAPVRVRLRHPTGLLHRPGDPIQVMQASGITAVGTVTREALPGDGVLFATNLPSLPTQSTVVVEQGTTNAVFYRATQPPSTNGTVFSHTVPVDATTGRFRWPPIGRLAQVRIVASLPPRSPVQLDVALDGGETSLDIVIT